MNCVEDDIEHVLEDTQKELLYSTQIGPQHTYRTYVILLLLRTYVIRDISATTETYVLLARIRMPVSEHIHAVVHDSPG